LFTFCCSLRPINSNIEVNFGNPSFATTSGYTDANGYGDFEYQPPTGSKALCSANLDDPHAAIEESNKGCYVNTRNGTGTSATISDVNFDVSAGALVIIKSRDNGRTWSVYDTERGANKRIRLDATQTEVSATDELMSFSSSGYTLMDANVVNSSSGESYLDIVLRKGAAYGLDIIKYTGDGTASHTISHSLGQVPSMMWVKSLDNSYGWYVYHKSLHPTTPEDYYIVLNGTAARVNNDLPWAGTKPDADNFYVGTQAQTNANNSDFVSYIFTDIPGYCKAFSFTGNGDPNGPFINLGFRPRWLFIKRADGSSVWVMYDAVRNTYNGVTKKLYMDDPTSEAEDTVKFLDFYAEGFKCRGADFWNVSGATHIGFAWAEAPGKWSNAR
jgi:hypothetical protein